MRFNLQKWLPFFTWSSLASLTIAAIAFVYSETRNIQPSSEMSEQKLARKSANESLKYLREAMDRYHSRVSIYIYEDVSAPGNHFHAWGKIDPQISSAADLSFPLIGFITVRPSSRQECVVIPVDSVASLNVPSIASVSAASFSGLQMASESIAATFESLALTATVRVTPPHADTPSGTVTFRDDTAKGLKNWQRLSEPRFLRSYSTLPDIKDEWVGVTVEVSDSATAIFPDGAASGVLTLSVVENSRLPASLPPRVFSSTVVQSFSLNTLSTHKGITFEDKGHMQLGGNVTSEIGTDKEEARVVSLGLEKGNDAQRTGGDCVRISANQSTLLVCTGSLAATLKERTISNKALQRQGDEGFKRASLADTKIVVYLGQNPTVTVSDARSQGGNLTPVAASGTQPKEPHSLPYFLVLIAAIAGIILALMGSMTHFVSVVIQIRKERRDNEDMKIKRAQAEDVVERSSLFKETREFQKKESSLKVLLLEQQVEAKQEKRIIIP